MIKISHGITVEGNVTIGGTQWVVASGGTETTYTTSTPFGTITYRVHTFDTPTTTNFVVSKGGDVEYLLVGGGGAGGGNYAGGGGDSV